MFTSIVVGSDGSATAREAVRTASRLAHGSTPDRGPPCFRAILGWTRGTHPDGDRGVPSLAGGGLLHGHRRLDRFRRRGEDRHEPVPGVLHLFATSGRFKAIRAASSTLTVLGTVLLSTGLGLATASAPPAFVAPTSRSFGR